MTDVLLDTHIWIWAVEDSPMLGERSRQRIVDLAHRGRLLVPIISVWEVGMLVAKGKVELSDTVERWVQRAFATPWYACVPLTVEAALAASVLPEGLHRDPADRMIVALARERGCPLMTRDRGLLAYAAAGHLDVIPA